MADSDDYSNSESDSEAVPPPSQSHGFVDCCSILRSTVTIPSDTTQALTIPLEFSNSPFQAGDWHLAYVISYHPKKEKIGVWKAICHLHWKGVVGRVKLLQRASSFSIWAGGIGQESVHFLTDTHGNYPFGSAGQYCVAAEVPGNVPKEVTVKIVLAYEDIGRSRSEPDVNLVNAALLQQHPNDVLLHFPHTSRTLWASSAVLRSKSSFFRDVFTSGFSESVQVKSSEEGKTGSERERNAKRARLELPLSTFDDSDLEEEEDDQADDCSIARACDEKHYSVSITNGAYRMYKAILIWLMTGRITFTPRRQSSSDQAPSASNTPPTLPNPFSASPRSIYRAAKFLDIPDLAAIALKFITEQLTVATVATEAFGEMSRVFPEIQAVVITFMAKHYNEVEETDGMKEIMKQMEEDSLPHAAATMLKIHQATMRLKK